MKKENFILFLKIFVLFTIISTTVYCIFDLIFSGKVSGTDLVIDLVFSVLGSLIITNSYKTKEGRITEEKAIRLIEKHKLQKEEDETRIVGYFSGLQKIYTKSITYNKSTGIISGPAYYLNGWIKQK